MARSAAWYANDPRTAQQIASGNTTLKQRARHLTQENRS